MNVYELIDPDDWDTLPEDPQEAFARIVRLSQRRLAERVESIMDRLGEEGSAEVNAARFGFLSTLLGIATEMKIEAFEMHRVPAARDFDRDSHLQFEADLNHYLAQVATQAAMRKRDQSTGLDDKSRSRIRGHLHALKSLVDKSSLTEKAKKRLLDRLAAFERDLDERGRINIAAAVMTIIAVMAIPGDIDTSNDAVRKLGQNVIQELVEAKRHEEEAREALIPYQPRITARPSAEELIGGEAYDLHDDIPF